MATTGIFGLGAYIYVWYVVIYNTYKSYKQDKGDTVVEHDQ
jgi:hypothetical protein